MATISDSVLLQEWDWEKNTLLPTEITTRSNKKVWWKCEHGHPWEAAAYNRSAGRGCPYCSGRKVWKGFNDLVTTYPELAAQWDWEKNTMLPTAVTAGSNKKIWWACEYGHSWEATVASRVRGRGCPYCSGQKVWSGFNDLATTHPALLLEWDFEKNSFPPTEVSSGSEKKVWWKCEHGHSWEAVVCSRTKGVGCPYCSGQRVWKGFNDLATTHPNLLSKWDWEKNNILPSEVSIGFRKKVWWKCEYGHSWEATILHRATGRGCPYCAGKKVWQDFNDLATIHPYLLREWDWGKNSFLPSEITAGSGRKTWWKCKYGHSWEARVGDRMRGRGCPKCAHPTSLGEDELYEFICSLLPNGKVIQSDRSLIAPYEVDIYIPEKKIAVEYNGLFWHSEAAGKGKGYHRAKYLACQAAGVQLFTVWEDEWEDKRPIVEAMLKSKLGVQDEATVFARQCAVTRITSQESRVFLNAHHIQGACNGSVHLGLEYGGRLVAVMVIKKACDSTAYLERYATSCHVVGGMGKLLKPALKWCRENDVTQLVTFSDNQVSDGHSYATLGFTLDRELPPDYKYFYDNGRQHKFGFRLKRFRDDPQLYWQEGLTEKQLAELNNIPRIWDAGKKRWVFNP